MQQLKKHEVLKEFYSLPIYNGLYTRATTALAAHIKSKGCDSYLNVLESLVREKAKIGPPSGDGCIMSAVMKAAFACAPFQGQLAALKANGHPTWVQARAARIESIETSLRVMISDAIVLQFGQLWKCVGNIAEVLTELLQPKFSGPLAEDIPLAYDEEMKKLFKLINSPLLLTACASAENTGMNKLVFGQQRAALDDYVQQLADVRVKIEKVAKMADGQKVTLRDHVIEILTELSDGESHDLISINNVMAAATGPVDATLDLHPQKETTQKLESTHVAARKQVQGWKQALARVAISKAEEFLRDDPSLVFTTVHVALLDKKGKGAPIKWSCSHETVCMARDVAGRWLGLNDGER